VGLRIVDEESGREEWDAEDWKDIVGKGQRRKAA